MNEERETVDVNIAYKNMLAGNVEWYGNEQFSGDVFMYRICPLEYFGI